MLKRWLTVGLLALVAALIGASIVTHWLAIRATEASRQSCAASEESTSAACARAARYCAELESADRAECRALLEAVGKLAATTKKPCPPQKQEIQGQPASPAKIRIEEF